MSALKLKLCCDNVIIGGGLAGLAASLRLPGKTILLSGGLGATAVSTGVVSPGDDREALSWFLELMADTRCRYVSGACVTVSRSIKSGLVQASVLYGGEPVLVSINEFRPGFRPVEFKKGRSHQEIARILDTDDDAAAELANALSGIKAESFMLPPILGIKRAEEVRARLSARLGADVREYVTAPSVLGLRLLLALREKVPGAVEMLDTVRVERIADGRVEGRMGTGAKREIVVYAGNLFIATGGPLTGFTVEGDRLLEPLTRATVSEDFEADLNTAFLSEHPLWSKGIGPELFTNGFDNVRAIGATSRGFGLYRALVSGYRAGEGLE